VRVIILCLALSFQVSLHSQENELKHVQIAPPDGGPGFSMQARSVERDVSKAAHNPLVELKGDVEIRTALCGHEVPARKMMVLHADEATYHEDTGEIETRGNVHIKFEPLK
jgi:lipopolysaccharide assembly outer membrane protein LptD (OstA)